MSKGLFSLICHSSIQIRFEYSGIMSGFHRIKTDHKNDVIVRLRIESWLFYLFISQRLQSWIDSVFNSENRINLLLI